MKFNYNNFQFLSTTSMSSGRFFDPNWTRFRWVFIRDMQVNYESINGFYFISNFFLHHQCHGIERFFDPNWTRFCLVFIRDMKFNYNNFQFLSTTPMSRSGSFWTQIGPFVGFSSGICRLTMKASMASFSVPISFYIINAMEWKLF